MRITFKSLPCTTLHKAEQHYFGISWYKVRSTKNHPKIISKGIVQRRPVRSESQNRLAASEKHLRPTWRHQEQAQANQKGLSIAWRGQRWLEGLAANQKWPATGGQLIYLTKMHTQKQSHAYTHTHTHTHTHLHTHSHTNT